jgi:membrane associated rhomboid family serine protease
MEPKLTETMIIALIACIIGGAIVVGTCWVMQRFWAGSKIVGWLLTLAGVIVLAFSRLIVFPGLKGKFVNNWPLVDTLMVVASFGCAVQLYRFSWNRKHSLPVATILIIGVTAVFTGLQFVFPELLTAFRRNREALLAGEWWRMVTPMFVQWAGAWQAFANGVWAVSVCPLAERFYGKRLLALFFVPGILGQIFAYHWFLGGAGSSLGLAGVMGGLFAFTFSHRSEISESACMFSVLGIAAAVVMFFNHDTHGPPMLIGFLLACMMTKLWPNKIR